MIKHICGNAGLQMRRAQDPSIRSQPNFQETQKRYIGATFYAGGMSVIITNDEDLLENRFLK